MKMPVEQFIKDSFVDSKADLLLEAFQIFLEAQLESYQDDFNDLLMQEGNLDRMDLTSRFEQMVMDILFAMIKDHGVTLDNDTPLWMVNQVCSGLIAIQYYLDTEQILRVIESDSDSEEKLAQIIAFVNNIDDQAILPYLHDVNPSLLDKIEELFSARVFESPADLEKEAKMFKLLRRVKDILRFLGSSEFRGAQLLQVGVLAGNEFAQYMRYFQYDIDTRPIEDAAKELFVVLAMSSDGSVNPLEVYAAQSDFLFHDLDKITRVRSQLSKLILEFDRYMLARSAMPEEGENEKA